jgi:putative transposase
MGVHAAPRLPGFDYIGPYAYSVTCCTFSRHAWFVDAAAVDAARAQLLHHSKDEGFDVLAYCFVPDHVHLLIEGVTPTSDLPRLIARWKQKTGYYHRHATNTALWHGGFFDHILREEEDRDKLVRYILANPIRAGLVMDVREYPFWGSGVCSREELIAALFDRPAP